MTRCQSDGAPSNRISTPVHEHLRPLGRVSEGGGVSPLHSRRLSYPLDRRPATGLDDDPVDGITSVGVLTDVSELTTRAVPVQPGTAG